MKVAHSAKRAAVPTLHSISNKHPTRSINLKWTFPTRFVLTVEYYTCGLHLFQAALNSF
jgi:hypothetical protein